MSDEELPSTSGERAGEKEQVRERHRQKERARARERVTEREREGAREGEVYLWWIRENMAGWEDVLSTATGFVYLLIDLGRKNGAKGIIYSSESRAT